MQSIATTNYANSISVVGFPKVRTIRCDTSFSRGIRHWTPSVVKERDANLLYEDKSERRCRFDSNCTLDTSSSSSIEDAIEEDASSNLPLPSGDRGNAAEEEGSRTNRRSQLGSNTGSNNLHVRFSPETAQESTTTTRRKIKKRKGPSDGSSSPSCDPLWYTKQELKNIQQSCILAVRKRDLMSSMWPGAGSMGGAVYPVLGDPILDRFSESNRKRRKLVRWKMYETTKVIKEFETATGTKTSPEFLSELLCVYSKPMEMDAIELAFNMTTVGEVSDPEISLPMATVPHKNQATMNYLSGSNTASQLMSDEMYVPLDCARMLYQQFQGAQRVPSQQHHAKREQLNGL